MTGLGTTALEEHPNLFLSSSPQLLKRLILDSRKLSAEQPPQKTRSNFNIRKKMSRLNNSKKKEKKDDNIKQQ